MGAPQHSRWLDRIVGAAIGAMATAWWLWPRAVDERDVIAQGDVAPSEATFEAPPPEPQPVATPPPEAEGPTAVIDEPPRELETALEPPIEPTDAKEDASAVVAASAAPTLPLPRMPGDTRLSSSSRFDEKSGSWIVKAAYRVVAREHHVVAFYRKALADQGLTVTQSQAQPGADGSVKTYLHGKSGRIHAQVGISPRTDVLETRVWILWRTRA